MICTVLTDIRKTHVFIGFAPLCAMFVRHYQTWRNIENIGIFTNPAVDAGGRGGLLPEKPMISTVRHYIPHHGAQWRNMAQNGGNPPFFEKLMAQTWGGDAPRYCRY